MSSPRLGLLISCALVLVLALPSLTFNRSALSGPPLHGYTDSIPEKPPNGWPSLADRSLQRWVERRFEVKMGLRAWGLRAFNELNWAVFREAPRLGLMSTPADGLYSTMSLNSLNWELTARPVLEVQYTAQAQKFRSLQDLLARHGKHFEVVIASSKPYVSPESLGPRYLAGGNTDVFDRAASFGDHLKAAGVNVIDAGPILRDLKKNTGLQTHPYSGVHWNYAAGCVIASRLLADIRRAHSRTPGLDCGPMHSEAPRDVDLDGVLLLNLLSGGGLLKPSLYPTISAAPQEGLPWRPKILWVGDSFSDQMLDALRQAESYSRLTQSRYFRTRDVVGPHGVPDGSQAPGADESLVRDQVLGDLERSDVVVLEMVEYNVPRWGYGFAEAVLSPLSSHGGNLPITSVEGAHPREGRDAAGWHWASREVTFGFSRFLAPDEARRSRLRFTYAVPGGTRPPHVVVTDSASTARTVPLDPSATSQGSVDLVLDIAPNRLVSVRIGTEEPAVRLGTDDPRQAAIMVRDLSMTPLVD